MPVACEFEERLLGCGCHVWRWLVRALEEDVVVVGITWKPLIPEIYDIDRAL